jgi:glycosyltransferase involved in cell wall biosynthesis
MTEAGRSIVMVTSSYPRFPGDAIATFMEPIARGVAARGHSVHVVLPWHPRWRRGGSEDNLAFHLYRYAPTDSLYVFGYAGSLMADVRLRSSALAVAPFAVAAGAWRTRSVANRTNAALIHAHWVVPGGVQGLIAATHRPLIVSLHGSDVFVAERHRLAGAAARAVFARAAWVTACSADLQRRAIALGAPSDRTTVVPYGVDSELFRPDHNLRAQGRSRLNVADDADVVLAFGRLVAKKGFEHLIDGAAELHRTRPALRVVIAGQGDLAGSLRARAIERGLGDVVQFPGVVEHQSMPALLAAADVAVVPSVHDAAGNVDGLPNTVLEIMASGTPLVATSAGGIASVAADNVTARLVPERDPQALARAIGDLLDNRSAADGIGKRAREVVRREHSWTRVAEDFGRLYDRVMTDRRT